MSNRTHMRNSVGVMLVILAGGIAAAVGAAPSSAASFKGRVFDAAGKPLAGVEVILNRVSGPPLVDRIETLKTVTDSTGAYELPWHFRPSEATEASCQVWYEKRGFVRGERKVTVALHDGVVTQLDVRLEPGLVLSGVVRVASFTRRQLETSPNLKDTPELFTVTGPNFKHNYLTQKGGAFEIYVPPGEYRLAAGFGDQAIALTGVRAGSTNLVLARASFAWTAETVGTAFDNWWQAMNAHYSYFFLRTNVDWAALKQEFRPRAVQATDAGTLAKVLQEMLAPLRDLHVWIETPDDFLPTPRSSYTFNGNGRTTRQAIEETAQCGKYAIVGRTKQDGFGYFLMLRQSNATDDLVRQAAAAIGKLRDAPGFIVDLRQANGGSEPLAQEIARLFCEKDVVYAKHKYRNGPGHADFTPESQRVLKATANPYTKPVVCLIGPGAVSSGEGFVKMMKSLPHVTTVGLPTRGASGNPQPFPLEGTGIVVTFSRWVDLMPDGQTFEGRGIPPDVTVDEPTSAYAERDPTLEKALEVLRGKVAEAKLRKG